MSFPHKIKFTKGKERMIAYAHSDDVRRTDADLGWQNMCEFPEAERTLPAGALVKCEYMWGWPVDEEGTGEPIDVSLLLDKPMTGREASDILMDLYRHAMGLRREVPRDAYTLEQVDEVRPGKLYTVFYGT